MPSLNVTLWSSKMGEEIKQGNTTFDVQANSYINQKMHFLKEIPVHEMQKLRKEEEKKERRVEGKKSGRIIII